MDYIQTVAKKLREGIPVVMYGAGGDAIITVMSQLWKLYELAPSAICDDDKGKHGKRLYGVEIQSLAAVLRQLPDANFVITNPIDQHMFVGALLDKGIDEARIINYMAVERRRSCSYLESYIVLSNTPVRCFGFCCTEIEGHQTHSVPFVSDYVTTLESFIAYRDDLIAKLNRSESAPCDGCPRVREDWYPAERKLRLINYGGIAPCNFQCKYCSLRTGVGIPYDPALSFTDFYDAAKRKNVVDGYGHIQISSGEITILPEREKIFSMIASEDVTFFTNAYIYSEEIVNLSKKSQIRLNVSIDAGTAATFSYIKGIDAFGTVCSNLRRYNGNGTHITLKYIFSPRINDNFMDVDGFAELCGEVADAVQISYDLHLPGVPQQNTIMAVRRLITALEIVGLPYRIMSGTIADKLCFS